MVAATMVWRGFDKRFADGTGTNLAERTVFSAKTGRPSLCDHRVSVVYGTAGECNRHLVSAQCPWQRASSRSSLPPPHHTSPHHTMETPMRCPRKPRQDRTSPKPAFLTLRGWQVRSAQFSVSVRDWALSTEQMRAQKVWNRKRSARITTTYVKTSGGYDAKQTVRGLFALTSEHLKEPRAATRCPPFTQACEKCRLALGLGILADNVGGYSGRLASGWVAVFIGRRWTPLNSTAGTCGIPLPRCASGMRVSRW